MNIEAQITTIESQARAMASIHTERTAHTTTGHDALCGFYWNGKVWTVSLYHAKHNTGIDFSEIAKKYGGGGHRGACGFTFPDPQFINTFTLCS